jgi:ABC-type Fe3+-hydroxamate transport system substrate-binding protein
MFFCDVTDHLGRRVLLDKLPRRIVSTVPSQTEWLFHLGLEERIVGITHFCERPAEKVRAKTPIGGTKNLKLERIAALAPDLILANKEENPPEPIHWLAERFPLWVSDVQDVASAADMMRQTARLTDRTEQAEPDIRRMEAGFEALSAEPRPAAERVLYLIWRKPYMSVGEDTFIHRMLQAGGWQNALEGSTRYPALEVEVMRALEPAWVFLSSEPFPFGRKHLDEIQALLPGASVALVDGSFFSWYGSRLLQAPNYFRSLRQRLERRAGAFGG